MTSTSSIHFEGSGAGGGHGGMTVSVHYGEVEDCPYKAAGSFTLDVDLPVVSVTWPKKHKQSKKLQIGDDIVRGWLEKLPFLPGAVHVVPRRCRMFFDFSNLATENREEAMQAVYDTFHDKPVVEMGSKGNSVVGSVKRNKAKLTQQSVTIGAEAEVPGLIVVKDWISESEEAEILALLNESEWEKKISRRVQHYGARFSYITRKVATGKLSPDTAEAKQKEAKEEEEDAALEDAVLPQWLQQQADRIAKEVGTHSFDQCTVNEYTPGKGIASHIDTHSAFEDAIASVSLGSGAVMDFSDHRSDRTVSVWMPRRCLLVMTGESRLAWAHRIKFRATDVVDGKRYKRGTRISLTFRKVRSEPCRCKFPEQCDSQLGAMAVTHGGKSGGGYLQWGKELKENGGKEEEADVPPLEGRHVREVYDRIADHFSHTRHTPWPRVEAFLKHLPDNQVVLDVGCGNGKYMGCNPKLHMLGCDTSIELLKIAKERGYQVFSGDVTAIPVRNEASDVTICIAVLHHICSEQRRLQAIHELKRVTKPGGQILIQVWAQEQDGSMRPRFKAQDVMVPWHLQRQFVSGTAEEIEAAGGVIDEQKGTVMFQRYCHVYCAGELNTLCESVPGITVEDSWFEKGNWVVLARRALTQDAALPPSEPRSDSQEASVNTTAPAPSMPSTPSSWLQRSLSHLPRWAAPATAAIAIAAAAVGTLALLKRRK